MLEIYEDENLVYLVLEYQAEGSLLNEIFKQQRMKELQVRIIME